MKRLVINVAAGKWYPLGQKRMVDSIRANGYDGDVMLWTNRYPGGCPTHQEVPYAFKVYAFLDALAAGYDSVLWLDCSLVAVRDITPIFEEMESTGHYAVVDNQKVGEWLGDDAMSAMSIESRDPWMEKRSLLIGCFGLTDNHDAREFLTLWKQYADDGKSFHGKSENDGSVSKDPRVRGTRWEQTAASVIFHRLNWSGVFPPNDNMVEDGHEVPNERTIFICRRSCAR